MPLKIDEVFVFISEDKEGEGVIGMTMDGVFMPFVCADKDRVASLREHAKMIGETSKLTIKLIKLSNRTDVEVVHQVQASA